MCHFLWWRCDEEFIQCQLHRTCCTSLQVQQFHTLFHHLHTHSKLILTACIALLFKNPWLEWGFCRSEAKMHPSFPRSASIYPILGLFFIPVKIFHHTSIHHITTGLGANSNLWLGHVQVQPTSLQEKALRRWPSWPFWRCSILDTWSQSWASAIIQA